MEPEKKFGYLRDVVMEIRPEMYVSRAVKSLLNGDAPEGSNVPLHEMPASNPRCVKVNETYKFDEREIVEWL